MRYQRLGNRGVKLSTVGLGSWLTYGNSVEEATARACIEKAWDHGVTFFDTANVYARGRAEEVVGRALAAYPRDQYVLATKVYFPMGDGPNDRGLSRKHVMEQLHASLKRLGTDYVDLYQCHRFDEETPVAETCAVMNTLIEQGKVLYWGVSEWTAEQIDQAVRTCREHGWAEPASNQPQYSALRRQIERDVLPMCERHGMGNVVWSPLAQGVLTGKYRSATDLPEGTRATSDSSAFMTDLLTQDTLDAVQRLRPIADDAGITLAQLAIAWCLHQPAVTSAIVGASRPEQLDDTLAAADITLSPAVVEQVNDTLQPALATSH